MRMRPYDISLMLRDIMLDLGLTGEFRASDPLGWNTRMLFTIPNESRSEAFWGRGRTVNITTLSDRVCVYLPWGSLDSLGGPELYTVMIGSLKVELDFNTELKWIRMTVRAV